MQENFSWLSPKLQELYFRLYSNINENAFSTNVVREMFKEWSISYTNKNLHELVKRGWAKRIQKGVFRLIDIKDIIKNNLSRDIPKDILLSLPNKEKMVFTSYFASQFLTRYLHTSNKIMILCNKKECDVLTDYLKAKCRFKDNRFKIKSIEIEVKPVRYRKFNRILNESIRIKIYDEFFRFSDPLTTLEYLSRETEKRKFADIAFLVMKTKVNKRQLSAYLPDEDIKEVNRMIEYRRDEMADYFSPVSYKDLFDMNLVVT